MSSEPSVTSVHALHVLLKLCSSVVTEQGTGALIVSFFSFEPGIFGSGPLWGSEVCEGFLEAELWKLMGCRG